MFQFLNCSGSCSNLVFGEDETCSIPRQPACSGKIPDTIPSYVLSW